MADTFVNVYGPAQPGTGNGTLYTSTGLITVIREIRICNTTTTAATISLAINGTAATAANCFLSAFSIPANGEYLSTGSLVLESGDTLQGLQGTGSALTVTVSGVTIS